MESKENHMVEPKAVQKRTPKPGMVRVMVSITQEHHDKLVELAKAESPVFPRPVNEYLSIQLEKEFRK
jgi:hypothetical protein